MKKRKQLVYYNLAYNVYKNAKICVKCYSIDKICVHHKDNDFLNNSENNLQILCDRCHKSYHANRMKQETKDKISKRMKWNNYWLWVKLTRIQLENRKKVKHKKCTMETKRKISKANKWKWKLVDWMWITEWREKTWSNNYFFYKK